MYIRGIRPVQWATWVVARIVVAHVISNSDKAFIRLWAILFFYIKWVVNFMTLDVRHLKCNKMILVGNYAC